MICINHHLCQWNIAAVNPASDQVQILWANDPSLGWSVQNDTQQGEEIKVTLEPISSGKVTTWTKQPKSVPGLEHTFT